MATVVVTIHIARDRISGQAANRCADKDSAQAAMGHCATDNSASDCADDGASRVVMAAARVGPRTESGGP
jgi:hypothetical protein